MSKLPTRFVIAFLAIGMLVGAATTTTVISGGLKPSNLALAQLRAPFLAQQPQVQAPLQQQPVTTASSSGGGSFGPNCVGCVSTQNLANGAVTNPKLGQLSVSSANIGQGQVTTGNIAPGAVSITTQKITGPSVVVPPDTGALVSAACPQGTVITGGGFNAGSKVASVLQSESDGNAWSVGVHNGDTVPLSMNAVAQCATIHP